MKSKLNIRNHNNEKHSDKHSDKHSIPQPKQVSIKLNKDNDNVIPLEYNFTTQQAIINENTYTFSFPETWRTSDNKNIIGIRKISYFNGITELIFKLGLIFNLNNETYGGTFPNFSIIVEENTTVEQIVEMLNIQIDNLYTDIQSEDEYGLKLPKIYKFEYEHSMLKLVKENIEDIYNQQIVIQTYPITEQVKIFFNLSHYLTEFYTIQTDIGKNDVSVYNISNFSEIVNSRKSDFQVYCSFVAQSDIQYVGLVGETFCPIKYYDLNNENRYFQMKLKNNSGNDFVLTPLYNDYIIIETQLL